MYFCNINTNALRPAGFDPADSLQLSQGDHPGGAERAKRRRIHARLWQLLFQVSSLEMVCRHRPGLDQVATNANQHSCVSNVNQVHLQESAVSSESGQAGGLRRVRPPLTVTLQEAQRFVKTDSGARGRRRRATAGIRLQHFRSASLRSLSDCDASQQRLNLDHTAAEEQEAVFRWRTWAGATFSESVTVQCSS